MKCRNFNVQLSLRTAFLLISILSVGVVFTVLRGKGLFFIPAFLIILILLQVIWILNFVKRVNREITEVFRLIRTGNYLPSLPGGKYTDSFSELFTSINEVFTAIRDTEKQKEAYQKFTEILMSLIPVGVILLKPQGKIELINKSALDILLIPRILRWPDLKNIVPEFALAVDNLTSGGTDLVRISRKGTVLQLSIQVRPVIMLEEKFRVITFHDIRNSVEKIEIRAWSGLFRVIRHEILNSVSPITSLAETMQLILDSSPENKSGLPVLSEADLSDIHESVAAIKLRSEGLFNFVNLYRDISTIPSPEKKPVSPDELFGSVSKLVRTKLDEGGIQLQIEIPEQIPSIDMDPGLMQQVLINLVNNSMAALEQRPDPQITIRASTAGDMLHITFLDNGAGIPLQNLDDIFIPFYTTRKEGSGLGLSLVKQIIISHGGHISVDSVVGEYTRFIIELPVKKQQVKEPAGR